jgi:hypothetical protein
MMIRRRILTTALCALVLALAAPLFAHEGHDHKVMGTVTMAAPDHLMLKDRAGKDVTIQLTSETKIVRDKQPVTIDEVKAGTRVVVTAVMDDKDRMTARLVEVGPAPAAKK